MALEHQVQRWVRAGVISSDQGLQILELERVQDRPTLLYAVAGLGGLAIAVGFVSIVASNWDDIPGRVKIGLDLALVAGVGAGVWQWDRRGPGWAREVAIVALWGLVLASIALIGQVYQQGGRIHEALLAWSVMTALLMSRARSNLAATLWILGLQLTWVSWCVWFADETDRAMLALGTIYWAPLLCLALGRGSAIRRLRPALARTLEAFGWGELVLCATLGTFAFYEDTTGEPWRGAYPAVGVSVVLTLAMAAFLRGRAPERVLLVVCLALAHVPLFTSTGDLDVVAALCFVGLWLLVAWSAHDARDAGLLNFATAMIGVRILAIYFEVIGTMLDTGLGLIVGGLVTLALVWVWTQKRKQFKAELEGEGT